MTRITVFGKNLKLLVICFLFTCIFSQIAYSGDKNKENTIDLENKAKKLSGIWKEKEILEAITLFEIAAKNWETSGNNVKAAQCLREKAILSFLVSKDKIASISLKKALKLDKKINNIEGQVISHSLSFQINLQVQTPQQKANHINSALKLSEKSTDQAKAFSNFVKGESDINLGKLNDGLIHLKKAYSHSEKIDDLDLKANILLNLGIAYAMGDDHDQGLKKINEALILWEKTDNQRGLMLTKLALGFIYFISDDKQKALENYQDASGLIPDDIDLSAKLKSLAGIGSIYETYGRYKQAKHFYQKSLKLSQDIEHNIMIVNSYHGLGRVSFALNELNESIDYLEKAKNLSKKFNFDFFQMTVIETIGNIKLEIGNYDEAIENFIEVQRIFDNYEIRLPGIENSLGKAYEKKGNIKIARKFYNSALTLSINTKDSPRSAEILYNLANLNRRSGNTVKALEQIKDSIILTETLYNEIGNNNLRESYFSNTFDRYDLYINLLMQMNESFPDKGFEVKALQASEKARTRLMRENLRFSEDEFTIDADPELVKKENNLARRISLKKEELTTKLSEGEKDEHLDILIGEISNLDDRLQSIRDTLKRKSPIYSAIKSPDDFDISKFQKNILDDQTVLIEFFFGKRKSYVWLISKSGFEVFTLPKFQQLEYRIDRLLKLINARDVIPKNNVRIYQKLIAENEQNYWIEAKELSQILFGQFAGKLKNKRLLIVPDGRLSFFPISALPSPEDELNKPFIFTNEIIYESSASMLQLIRSFRNLSTPPEKDFIVYSDSVFSKNDERLTNPDYLVSLKDSENNKSSLALEENAHISLDNLERLDKSRNETENIFKNFEINNSTIVSGFDANRTNFQKKHHNNYKVLHFATHGLLNEEIPELSGIVLSQFDRDGRKQNGLIWLEDIYNLNLSADLVVLSACDTGIGKDVKGEGLMSLTNGFLQVGAKSVISSHWKVDDEATVELMKIYYEILAKEKVSTSRALQLAQIKLAENPKFQFPYYWSSFTIHGDFIIRPQLKSRFDYSEYFIYLIITLISVALLNRFKKHSLNKLFNYK